jgi:hypothetical protein
MLLLLLSLLTSRVLPKRICEASGGCWGYSTVYRAGV